jgi:hypothetical protein
MPQLTEEQRYLYLDICAAYANDYRGNLEFEIMMFGYNNNDRWEPFILYDQTIAYLINRIQAGRIRRKPKPEYVPFDVTDDLRGKHVIDEDGQVEVIAMFADGVSLMDKYGNIVYRTYQTLFEYYTTIDGHPAGKLKE